MKNNTTFSSHLAATLSTSFSNRDSASQSPPSGLGCFAREDIDFFAEEGIRRSFPVSRKLLDADQKIESLFLVQEGNVQALLDDRDRHINRLHPGEVFGEISFLDGGTTSIPVIAEAGAVVLEIEASSISRRMETDPDFGLRFYRYLSHLLAKRLRRTSLVTTHHDRSMTPAEESEQTSPSIRSGSIEVRRLEPGEGDSALKLLHEIYIEELQWDLLENTPSRIAVVTNEQGEKILTDKLVSDAAWFGAFHDGSLIGCVRALAYPRIELRDYIDLPVFLDHADCTEVNRLAIAREHRNSKAVTLLLLRAAFDYALSLGNVAIATAVDPDPCDLFVKMGMNRFPMAPFQDNQMEDQPVSLLYFDKSDSDLGETRLYQLTDRLLARG